MTTETHDPNLVRLAVEAAKDLGIPLVWLSFCDSDLPAGSQFLGCAIVPGLDLITAIQAAHMLGCNPGGEVQGHPIPAKVAALIPGDRRGVLMDRPTIERFDAELGQQLRSDPPS